MIKMPDKPNEFDIQSYLHHELKKLYPHVHGEVVIKGDRRKGERGARFDLVCFDAEGQAVLVIEVKRDGWGKRQGYDQREGSKQEHYSTLAGCACIYIKGMADAVQFISEH